MDVERALISKCIDGNIEQLVARGIGPNHFGDDANRAVFTTIIRHTTKYGQAPSRDTVLTQHPGYKIDVVPDALDYVIDLFTKHVQHREAQAAILDLTTALDPRNPDHDTMDLDMLFMAHAERVAQAIPTSRVSRLSDVPNRITLYKKMQREGRLPGIPLGIPTLDRILLGVQPHEMVVVSAASNVGKSTFLQFVALNAYLAGQNKKDRPVFITLEMKADALLRKFDVMAANFRYNALRALELHPEEMELWETWGEKVDNAPNDIIIIDDIQDCTVERVFAETLRWKPSAMFVDYFGIMTPSFIGDKQYQGMAQMAKALKRVPTTTGVPLFTAAQTNRSGFKDGVRPENVADTIEIFRSADIMVGLERDEEETPNEMLAKLVKTRDSGKGEATLDWDMENMQFGERGSFSKKRRGQAVVFSTNPVADTPHLVTPEEFKAKLEEVKTGAPPNPFAALSAPTTEAPSPFGDLFPDMTGGSQQ